MFPNVRESVYQLFISTKDSVIDYEHKLSLNNAVISTKFIMGSTTFKREYFASHAHDVLVIRLSADKKNSISFKAALSRPPERAKVHTKENTLSWKDS